VYTALLAVFLALISTSAIAKHAGNRGNDHESKGSPALVLDLTTGECEVQTLESDSEPPEGLRVLGTYGSKEKAEAAEASMAECKSGTSGHNAAAKAAEADCRDKAKKSDSNLVSLFSKLTSGATNHSIYVECMKGRGYDVKE
jgi:hypothetical protein